MGLSLGNVFGTLLAGVLEGPEQAARGRQPLGARTDPLQGGSRADP